MEVFLKNEDYHIFLFAQMGFCAMPAAIDTPSRDWCIKNWISFKIGTYKKIYNIFNEELMYIAQ